MNREEKIALLKSIRAGEIKIEDLKGAGEMDIEHFRGMYIKNDLGGYSCNRGEITDEEYIEMEVKVAAENKRRSALGMLPIVYMTIE